MRHWIAFTIVTILVVNTASTIATAQPHPVYRVSTYAGKLPDSSPTAEVDALSVSLNLPIGIARAPSGNIYIGDFLNHKIRKMTPSGRVSVIAGTGVAGFTGNAGPATAAQIDSPRAMALDGEKYLYFSEAGVGNRVRRIDLATGVITHILGDGRSAFNGDGLLGQATSVSRIIGLAVDPVGNLLVSDYDNHRVRRWVPIDARVSTIAGNGGVGPQVPGANADNTPIGLPTALASDPNGDLYIFDNANGAILRVSNGIISNIAGSATATASIGPASKVRIALCLGMALSPGSTGIYFTDETTDTTRFLNFSTQQISLVAGNGVQGFSGDNGPAVQASFGNPNHLVVDGASLIIADPLNNRLRRVVVGGIVTTIAGGATVAAPVLGDGGPATRATLTGPSNVKLDPKGNLIVVDQTACLVRRIDGLGIISTPAGTPGACDFPLLQSAVADSGGQIFSTSSKGLVVGNGLFTATQLGINELILSSDSKNFYYITPGEPAVFTTARTTALAPTGFTSSLFAGGNPGSGGDGGPAKANVLSLPTALAEDKNGNIYILDTGNRNVRRVDIATRTISTVVQSDGFSSGRGLAVDPFGNVLVSVSNQIAIFNPQGALTALVGNGVAGLTSDGVAGSAARLNHPAGLASAPDGQVYGADTGNNRIFRLTPITPAILEALVAMVSATGDIPVQVRVKGSDGLPLSGVPVTYKVTPATARLSSTVQSTDADGVSTILVHLASDAATVTATVLGMSSVNIDVSRERSGPPVAAPPAISQAVSLPDYGAATTITAGGWMQIEGTGFVASNIEWTGADFVNGKAPTTLGGVKVTMNGIPAFIYYVTPGQIACLAPDGIGIGDVNIVVTTPGGSSDSYTVASAVRAPALLARASFKSGDRQYVTANYPDQTFVGPEGLVPGVALRPAVAGDHLTLWGVGFGATSPQIPAGQIAAGFTSLPNVQITFGDKPAVVEYAGTASGFVGLYQLNVVVPAGLSGDVPLTVTVDSIPVLRQLWITMK